MASYRGITLQFERREVFYRERAARYYSPEAYSLVTFLVEIPYVAFFLLLFVNLSYWLAGLAPVCRLVYDWM
jgi:ABC-type multidrug transport system permease subunit